MIDYQVLSDNQVDMYLNNERTEYRRLLCTDNFLILS